MIPKTALERGLKLAEGCRIFGVELKDLTHEEAIACAALGWDAERKTREELRGRLSSFPMMTFP